MKTKIKLVQVVWMIALAASALAQSPPNDNFTNRIALVGSSVTWTGDTTGATPEWDLEDFFRLSSGLRFYAYNDVWWSWTTANTSTAVLETLGASAKYTGYVVVYSNSDLLPYEFPICSIDLAVQGQYATFNAEAGQEYQIRFAIVETNEVVFRLTETNAPVFRLQPRTQTVSQESGVLFTSWAVGIKPLQYQWRHNGTNVPGATNAMLPIYVADWTNDGEYRVVVSSPTGGSSTSSVARLVVSTNDPLPLVRTLPPRNPAYFGFEVTGEEGRSYSVDASTNLSNWITHWPRPFRRYVLNNTNVSTEFQIIRDAPIKFFRLVPYHPENEICNLNLKQLRFALWRFAEDQHKEGLDPVSRDQAQQYMIGNEWPKCPVSLYGYEDYYISSVSDWPTCIMNHVLEEP